MTPHATLYDEVPYPSAIYLQTHPDRLATAATLFGMRPARVERCRVLELGCGDGTNLITMAFGLPESEFVGLDLAQRQIARGDAIVDRLRLKNIVLHAIDLLKAPSNLGRFDFIVAHGLYSWVPAAVRDRILAICSEHLTENGVAYVSYNTYPGSHLRDLVRGMMRYHSAHFREPAEQVRQARALLKFLAESEEEPDLYHQILERELERCVKYVDAGFFHDDLSPINHSVYFHEFIAHAAGHGLQYLSEASIVGMKEDTYKPRVAEALSELASSDIVTREQYLDFLRCRALRQTLLCRNQIALDHTFSPERIHGLHVAAEIRPVSAEPDVRSRSPELFQGPKGAELESDRPIVKTSLLLLGIAWPQSVRFPELLTRVRAHLGYESETTGSDAADDEEELANALLQAHAAGCVEFHSHAPAFVTTVGERPVSSPLARLQLERGNVVSTLRHMTLRIDDALGRHLLMLLDGTRDRAMLVEDLAELVTSGGAAISHEGKPVRDMEEILRRLADGLEERLVSLARAAVLIA